MKLAMIVIVLFLTALSTAYALDLPALAKRERARRNALSESRRGGPVRAFDDGDLLRHRRQREPSEPAKPRVKAVLDVDARDIEEEKAYWERERQRHQREVARVDASVRRLEWRLRERRSRRRPGERLSDDPSVALLEDSIESLREQRRDLDEDFRERARKAGALPGWLR